MSGVQSEPGTAAPAPALPGADGAQALGAGIHAIDAGYLRARFDAIHLVVEGGRAVIVDTGTALAAPRVLGALRALGLAPGDVDAVALTHVHLDHAGGAGALMQALPAARLLVHPRGARHMTDPARLWAGTVAVYGQARAEALYGAPIAVPASRVQVMEDGDAWVLAGRRLVFHDTPGHARHHHVIQDTLSGAVFTGDTFGIAYPELVGPHGPFVFPSSTPVQFDPPALRTSVRRILDLRPGAVFLTHYSRHDAVAAMGAQLLGLIDGYEALGESARALPHADRPAALETGMRGLLFSAARRHGCALDDDTLDALLGDDIRLNAAGIGDWLRATDP